MKTNKNNVYLIEHGTILNESDREFEPYSHVYDKKRGYYDNEQSYTTDPERYLKAVKEEIQETIKEKENYYIIITDQGLIDNYGDTFHVNDAEEIPVEDADYSVENIIYYEGLQDGKPFVIEGAPVPNAFRIRGFETVTGKEDTRLPERATEHSAGYDFFAREDTKILPHNLKLVWTGVKAYMRPDEVLKLYNRSSMAIKKGLMLSDNVAVIDSDYYNNPDNEGEIGFMFYNFTSEIAIIKKGEKLGQGIFEKYMLADNDVHGGKRAGGFGSTGF